MRNIVFFFVKEVKTHFNRVTVHIAGKRRPSRHAVEDCLLAPFHSQFQGFDMADAALMRHVDQCSPSVLMRVFMHAEIAASRMCGDYSISCTNISCIRDSIVIVHKHVINRRRLLRKIKRNGNILLVDIVDGVPRPENLPHYDGIICCSRKAYDYYSQSCPDTLRMGLPVYFVAHCTDPRIGAVTPPADRFAPYYFGAPKNLLLFDSLKPLLSIVYTDIQDVPNHDWHLRLAEANFHYAVRPPMKEHVYKPFMKGIIAATCNANMLVHKDDGDALYYLGEDYPYLIKEEPTEEVVLRYMRKAQAEFGTDVWRFGLSKMAGLRETFSNEEIAGQFWRMIEDATGRNAGQPTI